MAITKSAKKEVRKGARKRVFNLRCTRSMKNSIKDLDKKLGSATTEEIRSEFSKVQKAIDKATKRGVIKKNAASRKKSRLVKLIKSAEVKG